jgi:hypothetical protein
MAVAAARRWSDGRVAPEVKVIIHVYAMLLPACRREHIHYSFSVIATDFVSNSCAGIVITNRFSEGYIYLTSISDFSLLPPPIHEIVAPPI